MMIRIDEQICFDVTFDPLDREEGYDDDIRFTIVETTTSSIRVFGADETSILLTPEQAEQLARALLAAVEASRAMPKQ
jgi:hypothetical protein